jgi:hypothetical protein
VLGLVQRNLCVFYNMLLYVVVSSILDLTQNYAFKENYSVQILILG